MKILLWFQNEKNIGHGDLSKWRIKEVFYTYKQSFKSIELYFECTDILNSQYNNIKWMPENSILDSKSLFDVCIRSCIYKKDNSFERAVAHFPISLLGQHILLAVLIWHPCLSVYNHLNRQAIQGRRRRGAGGHVPPPLSKVGGHKWVCAPPPPHFWAGQVFKFHYLLIFCGQTNNFS